MFDGFVMSFSIDLINMQEKPALRRVYASLLTNQWPLTAMHSHTIKAHRPMYALYFSFFLLFLQTSSSPFPNEFNFFAHGWEANACPSIWSLWWRCCWVKGHCCFHFAFYYFYCIRVLLNSLTWIYMWKYILRMLERYLSKSRT